MKTACARKSCFDNEQMIDQLEAKIRAKAAMMDESNRITVNLLENKRYRYAAGLLARLFMNLKGRKPHPR